ncbi:MAG TPA: HTH-type transcriptional regulator CysB [Steroidobacteraceae bacterium]|nr:HTH-type transcriptional regulator CysB [Steroidobacteraceae bacterium]
MKLQQLRFLATVAQSELNITSAAAKLYTTQPAVSKQLRQLEDELGFKIFVRHGRALSKVTPPGERVIDCAVRVLREVQNIRGISTDFKDDSAGTLSIGTTHTQARYVLPPVIKEFRERYPKVQFNLLQGTSEQIAEMARTGRIDVAIATGSSSQFEKFVLLPCYRWHRQVIVPQGHPLARVKELTLEELGAHPIVSYVFSFTGPSSLTEAFLARNLRPNIALAARDADVIKTYVRLGIGVGIIANMAVDPVEDADLVVLDAAHLFPTHTTWVGFDRSALLRKYMYDFLGLLAPHLTRRVVDRARTSVNQADTDAVFEGISLPLR